MDDGDRNPEHEPIPPLIAGGQGRSAREVQAAGLSFGLCVGLGVMLGTFVLLQGVKAGREALPARTEARMGWGEQAGVSQEQYQELRKRLDQLSARLKENSEIFNRDNAALVTANKELRKELIEEQERSKRLEKEFRNYTTAKRMKMEAMEVENEDLSERIRFLEEQARRPKTAKVSIAAGTGGPTGTGTSPHASTQIIDISKDGGDRFSKDPLNGELLPPGK